MVDRKWRKYAISVNKFALKFDTNRGYVLSRACKYVSRVY